MPLQQEIFEESLGQDNHVIAFSTLCRDEISQFIEQRGEGLPPVLVGCEQQGEMVQRILTEAGWNPAHIISADLHFAFRTSRTPEEAHEKAVRMLLAELAAYRKRRAPFGLPLDVGNRVLVVSDAEEAWGLCRQLASPFRVTQLRSRRQDPCQGCREGTATSAEEARYCQQRADYAISALSGTVESISGHIGALRVEMRLDQPIDPERCVECLRCVAACPEGAIGADLVLDWNSCTECGECVDACGAVGAIDLRRNRRAVEEYDQIVLDAASPAAAVRRLGVLLFQDNAATVLHTLLENMGQWEKPICVENQPERCAYRHTQYQGCGLCLDACPYGLISTTSDESKKTADRYSCIGCGTCTAACPNEAIQQVLPSDGEVFAKLEEFAKGSGAVLYFCSQCGQSMLEGLKRRGRHIPANIYPLEIPCLNYFTEIHALHGIRHGLKTVFLWGCVECPHTSDSRAEAKVELANKMLEALDGVGGRVRLWRGKPNDEETILNEMVAEYERLGPIGVAYSDEPLSFSDRRGYIVRSLEEIWKAQPPKRIAFPVDTTAPYGKITVAAEQCTLCSACVGTCPSRAFKATDEQLEHFPLRCTACGLCVQVCPESCIELSREFTLDESSFAFHPIVTSEMQMCPRCGKPVGTKRTIEAIQAKLMRAGESQNRLGLLTLCADCRAIQSMTNMEEEDLGE
jgi:ferredoxin